MTREEQLDWLYRLRSEIYVYMPKEWVIPMNNALDMTIKAIEQEPCEDCVSRADVKIFLDKYNFVSYDYTDEDFVKALLSVTPQEPILDKIRAIVDEWQSDTWTDNLSYECMVKIAELVELQESEDKK